jgi:hypothetical protein
MPRSSENSQSIFQNMANPTILNKKYKSSPDIQTSSDDHQAKPTGPQLLNTDRNIFQSIQNNETLHVVLDESQSDTPTQILDYKCGLATTAFRLHSQLSDTQRNEFSSKGADELVDDNPELELPNTQRNTTQWMSLLLPPTVLSLPCQNFLMHYTQQDTRESEVKYLRLNTSIRLTKNDNLADTQVSSADNPEVPNLADMLFLKAGFVDIKTPRSPIPKVPFN